MHTPGHSCRAGTPCEFSGQHRNSQEQRQHGESVRILRPRMSSSVKEGCNRNFLTMECGERLVEQLRSCGCCLWFLAVAGRGCLPVSPGPTQEEGMAPLPAWGWGLP